jgi:tetratricopeptide (TPR) repeat protein
MTIVAYWPAIQHGGFIWDDNDYVTENKTLRDADGLKDIWMSPKATPQYYPLVHTGFWIEYQLWGLDPTGYHVTNVLLHALAALILWRLLRWLAVPGAWLAAALFALHPVHVESVAWITERKNVLSAVFYLGAALVYLKWVDAKAAGQRRPWMYVGAFLLFVCALLSKTVTTSLPAALLLVAWWREGRVGCLEKPGESPIRRWLAGHILPLVPFFVIGLAFSFITIWLEKHHVGAKGVEWDLSFIDRCLIAGRALWFYIGKLLWPAGLCFSYPRWEINAGVWWQYLYPLAYALVLVLLWAGRKRLGRGPFVAMLFFAGSLFPALGFIDVYPMRYSFVADHFAYLANITILVMVAAGLTRCYERFFSGNTKLPALQGSIWRLAMYSLSAILLTAMIVASAKQCRIYQNLETLWLDTIAKNPVSWMAYNNLGQLYLHENRHEEAVPLFEKSILHNPGDPSALNNLGVVLGRLGRDDEAKQRYQQAIAAAPLDAQAYHNLGVAMVKEGRMEEAIGLYRKALEIDPELPATHVNLGTTLGQLGRKEEAIKEFKKAVAIDPETGTFRQSHADALMAAGRVREAADEYRIALSLDPSLATAHYQLGMIAMADQLLPAALQHFRDALDAAPEFAHAYVGVAKSLSAMSRIAEAGEYFRRAVQFGADDGLIRYHHALFLAQHGDKAAARDEFLTASALLPEDPNPIFQAAVLDEQLGDPAAAEKRLQQVLKIDPDHAPACNHLAVRMAGSGRNQDAVDLMRRAAASDPTNAEYRNNLGVMLVRAGNRAEALIALEEAVRLHPGYAEARKNLEDLKRLMNQPSTP